MVCKDCNKIMKEETLFTTVYYSCDCNKDDWKTADEMRNILNLKDFPASLGFKDEDGKQGSVFITDIDYFSRCPMNRKFKLRKNYYDKYDI